MTSIFDMAFHEAKKHARQCYPEESCGIIIDNKYVPFENNAAPIEQHQPNNSHCNCKLCSFKIDNKKYAKYITQGEIQFIVHSHPDGNCAPSRADMESQIQSNVPWIIIPLDKERIFELIKWGEHEVTVPILGRSFIHGVTDCYSLLRDCFRLGKDKLAKQGITGWPYDPVDLSDFPRADEWWRGEDDLYMQNFQAQGFVEIPFSEVKAGDCFLMKIRSNKYNHSGVLIDDGLIIHHLPQRLSRREPAAIWGRQKALWARYVPKSNQENKSDA